MESNPEAGRYEFFENASAAPTLGNVFRSENEISSAEPRTNAEDHISSELLQSAWGQPESTGDLRVPSCVRFSHPAQHYKLIKGIGWGGSSTVYLAELQPRRRTGRRRWRRERNAFEKLPSFVALKFVWTGKRREAHGQQFMHKNVMKIYRSTTIRVLKKEVQVFAMEYSPGGNLESVTGETLIFTQIRDYAEQILRGIQYLHDQGFVHFDLKPGNILLSHMTKVWQVYFRVKIGDTDGLTRKNPDGSVSLMDVQSMTPRYVPPESVDSASHIDAVRADIWAFGLVLLRIAFPAIQPGQSLKVCRLEKRGYEACFIDALGDGSEVEQACPTFVDFLLACLTPDPRQRATSEQLLRHSFLTSTSSFEKNSSAPDFNGDCFVSCGCRVLWSGQWTFKPPLDPPDLFRDIGPCSQCDAGLRSDLTSQLGSTSKQDDLTGLGLEDFSPLKFVPKVQGNPAGFARLVHGESFLYLAIQGSSICEHVKSQLRGCRDNVRQLELLVDRGLIGKELEGILAIFRGIHTVKLYLSAAPETAVVSLNLQNPWLTKATLIHDPYLSFLISSEHVSTLELTTGWSNFNSRVLVGSKLPALRKLVIDIGEDYEPPSVRMKTKHFPVEDFPLLDDVRLATDVLASSFIIHYARLKTLTISNCRNFENGCVANFKVPLLQALRFIQCIVVIDHKWNKLLKDLILLHLSECCLEEESPVHRDEFTPDRIDRGQIEQMAAVPVCLRCPAGFVRLAEPLNLKELVLEKICHVICLDEEWSKLTRNLRTLRIISCKATCSPNFLSHLAPQLETLEVSGMECYWTLCRPCIIRSSMLQESDAWPDNRFSCRYLLQNPRLIGSSANMQEIKGIITHHVNMWSLLRHGECAPTADELFRHIRDDWKAQYIRALQRFFEVGYCALRRCHSKEQDPSVQPNGSLSLPTISASTENTAHSETSN